MEPTTLPTEPTQLAQPVQPAQPARPIVTGRTKAALWLMIGPTALLVATFMLFALTNWVVSYFATVGIATTIINVLLFVAGVISILTWLPGLIIGIILLATAKK